MLATIHQIDGLSDVRDSSIPKKKKTPSCWLIKSRTSHPTIDTLRQQKQKLKNSDIRVFLYRRQIGRAVVRHTISDFFFFFFLIYLFFISKMKFQINSGD